MAEAAITPIFVGTQTVTWAQINNNAEGDVTLTVRGAAVGRIPVVTFRSKFDAGVFIKQPARCTAANTVVITIRNESGGANTPTSAADIVIL